METYIKVLTTAEQSLHESYGYQMAESLYNIYILDDETIYHADKDIFISSHAAFNDLGRGIMAFIAEPSKERETIKRSISDIEYSHKRSPQTLISKPIPADRVPEPIRKNLKKMSIIINEKISTVKKIWSMIELYNEINRETRDYIHRLSEQCMPYKETLSDYEFREVMLQNMPPQIRDQIGFGSDKWLFTITRNTDEFGKSLSRKVFLEKEKTKENPEPRLPIAYEPTERKVMDKPCMTLKHGIKEKCYVEYKIDNIPMDKKLTPEYAKELAGILCSSKELIRDKEVPELYER